MLNLTRDDKNNLSRYYKCMFKLGSYIKKRLVHDSTHVYEHIFEIELRKRIVFVYSNRA